jgi:hypothetical protein
MSGIFDQVINYAPPSLLKGTVTYKGTWSADTNTPTLINPPDSTTNGFYYVVSAAGTQFSLSFNIGDWIISNGSAWEKVDNTDAVSSVFGRTGAVVGVSTDYSSVGITATAVGASSPSTGAFTTLSATTPLAVASGGTGVTTSTGTTNVVLSGSPTITTPVIAQINDANGNETLKLASIASAVNEISIENAATGNPVHIRATGGDASVGLHLVAKGASGYVNVTDGVDETKRLMFNVSGGTTNTRTMLSSTQTVDRTLSLPDATDTLVGKATTDTLTNKTITGGILNGTLGATTPSTVAATTGNFSGTLTSTVDGIVLNRSAAATTQQYLQIGNTGGNFQLGVERSTGGALVVGGSPYATVLVTTGATNIEFGVNLQKVAALTSTGLNSTAIGATTPSTGAFTTLSASSTGVVTGTFGVGAAPVSEKMRVQAAAGYNFVVDTNSSSLRISAVNDADSANVPFIIQGSTVTIPNGNVGIGAAATSGTLHVTSAGGAFGDYQLALTRTSVGTTTLRVGGSNELIIAPNGTDRASFTTSGAAITGTLSATGVISFAGDTRKSLVKNYADATGDVFGFEQVGVAQSGDLPALRIMTSSLNSAYIAFGKYTSATAYTEYARITNTGNVGIGTASPSAKLDVAGTINSTGLAVTGNISNTFAGNTQIGHTLQDTTTTSGSVFINFLKSTGGVIGSIARVTTTDAVVYNTTSDARLKENLRDFTDSGRLIDALKPRVFDWKDSDNNGKDVIGFVAQEEHAADPIFAHIGAVSVGDDDPTIITKQWQRSDAALIPILVAELQSLRKRLAALESK